MRSKAETGIEPEASTSGGTSDARFLKDLCPVIEFGLVNATMHKRDEAVAVDDLRRARANLPPDRRRPRSPPAEARNGSTG